MSESGAYPSSDRTGDAAALAQIVCPKCGLTVQTGYARCPKCKFGLPRQSNTLAAGGTALPEKGSPLMGLTGVALLVAGGIAFALFRFGVSGKRKPHVQPEPTTIVQPAITTTAPVPDLSSQLGTPTINVEKASSQRAAVSALSQDLRQSRLWSEVSIDGTIVVVQSAACGESGVDTLLTKHASDLRAAEITTVRCRRPHGEIAFERGL